MELNVAIKAKKGLPFKGNALLPMIILTSMPANQPAQTPASQVLLPEANQLASTPELKTVAVAAQLWRQTRAH